MIIRMKLKVIKVKLNKICLEGYNCQMVKARLQLLLTNYDLNVINYLGEWLVREILK